MIYLDSAIMVKMWIDEPDSEHWRIRLARRDDLISSVLILPEVRSALRQKAQAGALRPAVSRQSWQKFYESVQQGALQTIPIGETIVDAAIELLEQLPLRMLLRSLDALHLATARSLHGCSIATTDRRMIDAATHLSIPLIK